MLLYIYMAKKTELKITSMVAKCNAVEKSI